MLDEHSHKAPEERKRIPYKVQAVVIENFRVICQPKQAFERARASFTRQGFRLYETEHFLYGTAPTNDSLFLIHCLTEDNINNNLGSYLAQELHHVLLSDQAFEAAFQGVVASVRPHDPPAAWKMFSLNTLKLLRREVEQEECASERRDSIASFASLYRHLFSLLVGESLLDVGCACAFWPVLVAERDLPYHRKITGVDNRQDALHLSMQLATDVGLSHLEFLLADVLTPTFSHLGSFDTVTALHLLEHLKEDQLALALENLLQVTRKRLIIAVPYENHPTGVYGHQQVFDQKKLALWGTWGMAYLDGKGKAWCEEKEGGVLIIEKSENS